ncbi:Glyoxylase, beta-lactamase superfamily II [Tessaracoccus bendigoensis DSM 12906]|uniref:Glyoxylase, beta-lactamase superfamily II n=1 Tax=Tessaracoccus bendigoensis DSM 12906 TaxID=1123357 RepID=A0A1M6B657_9ACTN|nr:MBL fold metallo-hydrolase [Tessaracoccus bendigoensis]SHI44222.1 Glyoxylase, beta-lactamase superfamily II [Tessaracoccus bendigoensis DSM 12906]
MNAHIERLVTAGNVDPGGPPVHENNVWFVGDDRQVIVVDPAHDADAVARAVGGRRVVATLLTHGHWDHVRAVLDFAKLVGGPVFLHPADVELWRQSHDDAGFEPIGDGQVFDVAGVSLEARHTPGHTPGSTSFVAAGLGAVFTGDTLFEGGPGATRWDYSSFPGIIESIRTRLLTLPADTVVNTGHGPSTTIGAEAPHLGEWVARGW